MGNSKMKNLRPLEVIFLLLQIFIFKNIFACLFRVVNIISLSHHKQVFFTRLRSERYFSHHRISVMIMPQIFKENMRMGTIELTDLSKKKLRIAIN